MPWARYARPHEASTVVDIIRESISAWVIDRTVYGCAGATRYVRALINDWPQATPIFLVAGVASDVLATAEVAVSGDELFVSYIGTSEGMRFRGLGTALLLNALYLTADRGIDAMTLDVLEENIEARSWYTRLGFSQIAERGWWEVPLPTVPGKAVPILNLPQANVCQRAFGFSEVTLLGEHGRYRVGRLGTKWFRVTESATLSIPSVIATLALMDPMRKILVLDELVGGAPSDALGPPCKRSLRLRASTTALRSRLLDTGQRRSESGS